MYTHTRAGRAKNTKPAVKNPLNTASQHGISSQPVSEDKGRGYDSAIISAPITMGGERCICEVVITRKQDNRFYLHEVTPIKKLQEPY